MALPATVAPYLPELIAHISGGSIGILSGYAAVSVAKGERLHRVFGTIFVAAMLVMASMATYMAISLHAVMPGMLGNITGGIFAAYLVTTGWMTIKRKEGTIGLFEKLALVVIVGVAVTFLIWSVQASVSPGRKLDGYAAPFYYVFGGIAALIAVTDIRVILRGGVSGVSRIARHLWRMCFALFFAAASFFIGQQKVMPAFLHRQPILYVLGTAPLAFMIFWLIRVRLSKRPRSPVPAQMNRHIIEVSGPL